MRQRSSSAPSGDLLRLQRSSSAPSGDLLRLAVGRGASKASLHDAGLSLSPSIGGCSPGAPRHSSRFDSKTSLRFRRAASVRRSLDSLDLEQLPTPLAKGALRHRVPKVAALRQSVEEARVSMGTLLDLEEAEAHGRTMLGDDSWAKRLFKYMDGTASNYLFPAEFAALASKFEEVLEGSLGRFKFSFMEVDANQEGRVSMAEWMAYSQTIVDCLGHTKCKVATQRILGSRSGEARRKVGNIYMFDGFMREPSLRLLDVCRRAVDDPNLVENVRSALAAKADPNSGLVSTSFNDYTPLIFLAMAPPGSNGTKIGAAIDILTSAGADVHRACGPMATGRLVPMRFAAQKQNQEVLKALKDKMQLGDVFHWAAGENAPDLMLSDIRRLYGDATANIVSRMSPFSNKASVQLKLFASPMVAGGLSPDTAYKLCQGNYEDNFIQMGEMADPNAPGLEGRTALMHKVIDGDVRVIESLLAGRASVHQRDSSGATPLHYAACYAQPDLHALDHAGFSPWMLVGECVCFYIGPAGRTLQASDRQIEAAGDNVRTLLGLLKPKWTPEELLEIAERAPEDGGQDGVNQLLELMEGKTDFEEQLRLGESLFFNSRMAIAGAYEGRAPRRDLLLRVAEISIRLLQTPHLKGDRKLLTKYLLTATVGPATYQCGHIHRPWQVEDNRSFYRDRLMDAVKEQLGGFAAECNVMRKEIDEAAARSEKSPDDDADEISLACAALRKVPKDEVNIPKSWRETDPFWEEIQKKQVLRFDPQWARQITDGASCCMALLRLGVPFDPQAPAAKLKENKDACVVSNLADYSALRQVSHATMQELIARGFITYSNLCNVAFQDKMKEVATRAVQATGVDIEMPQKPVGAKRLKRVLEKTRDAKFERPIAGGWKWPGRTDSYLQHSFCFYILDTVRLSFGCKGETVLDQVQCCMKLLDELDKCTLEDDGVCILRRKSGFAAGVSGDGGYADIKLLCFASLGTHKAFDGTDVPLEIIGEVQLILSGYEAVKHRMHLAYEVNRGSFDRK
eukprot:TRINITY_DN5226_c0_g2_i1.p1 TRINITY_DN5226_c0_g2~~TRINITY_DN5226_c0_g2_i1.p1  ORF type:complete len:1024 (-),score=190.57 TRINITY_DN5226_c0_g2_i1:405-3476(-)